MIGRLPESSGRRYYLKDYLGSIRAVVEEGGGVQMRNYYPFGLPLPNRYEKGSPPTQEDYTGHVKDNSTGLHYAGARYYSAAFARWTTTDPILGEKGAKGLLKQDARLLTMTLYNYTFSNPIGLRDPTGFRPRPSDDSFRPAWGVHVWGIYAIKILSQISISAQRRLAFRTTLSQEGNLGIVLTV